MLTGSLSDYLAFFRILGKWNHAAGTLLCQSSCSQHNAFEIRPWWFVYQLFIFFLLLSSIPWYKLHILFCLSIYLLMDFWVVSNFWLLWMKLLLKFIHKSLYLPFWIFRIQNSQQFEKIRAPRTKVWDSLHRLSIEEETVFPKTELKRKAKEVGNCVWCHWSQKRSISKWQELTALTNAVGEQNRMQTKSAN